MNALLKKLNFKDQNEIVILHAPDEFSTFKESFKDYVIVHDEVYEKMPFVLVFVKSCLEIEEAAKLINEKLIDDALCWIAYPKKSSKKYKTDISRDNGWKPIGDIGFEPVRQVAIDDDWSALRFRETKFIKTMVRNSKMTLSKEGKKRTQK